MKRLIQRGKYGLERVCHYFGDRYGTFSCGRCPCKEDCDHDIWSKLALYEDMDEKGLVVASGHIEWRYQMNGDGSYSNEKKPYCSECGELIIESYSYCPHCGGKLVGGAKYKDYP